MGNHPDRKEANWKEAQKVCEKANAEAGKTIKELKALPRDQRRSGKPKKAKKGAEE